MNSTRAGLAGISYHRASPFDDRYRSYLNDDRPHQSVTTDKVGKTSFIQVIIVFDMAIQQGSRSCTLRPTARWIRAGCRSARQRPRMTGRIARTAGEGGTIAISTRADRPMRRAGTHRRPAFITTHSQEETFQA